MNSRRHSVSSQQRGYVLFTVIVMLVVVAVTALLVSYDSSLKASVPAGEAEASRADYVAEAALQHALWRAQNNACMGNVSIPATALGPDSYAAAITGAAAGTAYTLVADQDAWIRDDDVTMVNGSNADQHIRFETGKTEHALTRFDVSSLPAGAQINSATAWFYITSSGPGGGAHPEGPISVHRVTADWTETGATWETMGGKFESSRLATIPAQPDDDVWVSINLTGQVQAWVNGQPNFGVLMESSSEGVHGKYASRESSEPPYIEVVVGSGSSSPVNIQATGTLANGNTRALTRVANPAYQPPVIVTLQLGTDPGADATLDDFYPRNFGGRHFATVSENTGDWVQRPVLRFDLGGIPAQASVLSARLELQMRSLDAPGTATVHRVTRSWVEGTKDGTGQADGATWATYDGTNNWTTAGGDFNATPVAETAISGGETWVSWEIGPLVEQWLAGAPNDGLLIKGDAALRNADFSTQEDADATVHPKLTITYACECGSVCMAPNGSGNVLLVVGDPSLSDPEDAYKKTLFEAWGYAVDVQGDGAGQTSFDTKIAANDVVYISETIDATALGSKLNDAPIGVVNEDGWKNDDLGFESANSSNWPVGNSITITDTSHYITLPFASGSLPIYTADMGGLAIGNTPAPDLQSLANWGADTGLAVLESGAMTAGGTPTAGRRVMLPFGRDILMDWFSVNNNGLLIMQRALAWGMGADLVASGLNVLLVVVNPGSLNAQETAKKTLIETWGHTVNLIDESDNPTDFNNAIAANDVAYIPQEINSGNLGTKLVNATIGVVNEEGEQVDELGFSQDKLFKSRDEIDVIDNTHYITQLFATGLVTHSTALQSVHMLSGSDAPGLLTLAESNNTGGIWNPSLAVIETGGDLWGGGTFNINLLTADGLTIMERAIEWAAMTAAGSSYNVLLIVGNDTTLASKDVGYIALMESWGHTVSVIDDGASQASYDTAMAAADVIYASGSAVGSSMLDKATDTTKGLVNEVVGKIDNFGFSSSTSNTFSADTFVSSDAAHYISSPFSGAAVNALTTVLDMPIPGGTLAPGLEFPANFTAVNRGVVTLDDGAVRWDSTPSPGRRVHLPFAPAEASQLTADGKTILQRALEWAAGTGGGGGGGGGGGTDCSSGGTFRDEFNAQAWSGSDGTLTWAGDWLEVGESDGPTSGDTRIDNDLSNYQLQTRDNDNGGEGVEREADLSGAATATLSYDYRRNGLDNSNDYTSVWVSANGAAGPWQELLPRHQGGGTDGSYQPASHDISGFVSGNTRIRFLTSSNMGNTDIVWFDNIDITCAP